MCYVEGSVDQAVNACQVCKVFPHARCPHVREVCRNRALHPQIDVLYLKNAEVDWFNGCGYCKWARSQQQKQSSQSQSSSNSAPAQVTTRNTGWPGCCRPPSGSSEFRMIQAADWRSISIIWGIPIPGEVKAILDGMTRALGLGGKSSGMAGMGTGIDKKSSSGGGVDGGSSGSPPSKPIVKPGLGLSTASSTASKAVRDSGIRDKERDRGNSNSPKATSATLSKAPASPEIQKEKLSSPTSPSSQSAGYSPSRKHLDLMVDPSTNLPRRNSASRVPTNSTNTIAATKGSPDSRSSALPMSKLPSASASASIAAPPHSPERRRNTTAGTNSTTPTASPASLSKSSSSTPTRNPLPPSFTRSKNASPPSSLSSSSSNSAHLPRPRNPSPPSSSSSSSSGSSSGSDLSDSTVISSSEGFTDYLSDESEAEIQRQVRHAEARAALVLQNQQEEMEFKAARMQLVGVDLKPPKSWNPTNITNTNVSASANGRGVAGVSGMGRVGVSGQTTKAR